MEPVSSVLYTVFRGTPRHAEWMVACLEGAWPSLVGRPLSGVCRPWSFDRGDLKIEILDEAWRPALEGVRDQLCSRIRDATDGEVRRISLRRRAPGTGAQ